MVSIGQKADYVRSEMRKPAGDHHCHWPTCDRKVHPAVWGCKQHWYMLPARLRGKIWVNFAPGQEVSKTPATNYVETAREVREWIYENYPETCPRPKLEYDL